MGDEGGRGGRDGEIEEVGRGEKEGERCISHQFFSLV
jgi:hypothetical protein